jgi:uncharacterized membrane protein
MNSSFYTGLLHLHSFGRWLILLLLLVAIFRSATAGSRLFTSTDRRIGTILTIFADIMLLVGAYQWYAGKWGYKQIEFLGGVGEVMKNSTARFFAVEHLIGMLIAIILIHMGKAQAKRNITDRAKHKHTFIFYLVALLVILASIPWPFREVGADRGWF